jgi:hypothetical protein
MSYEPYIHKLAGVLEEINDWLKDSCNYDDAKDQDCYELPITFQVPDEVMIEFCERATKNINNYDSDFEVTIEYCSKDSGGKQREFDFVEIIVTLLTNLKYPYMHSEINQLYESE